MDTSSPLVIFATVLLLIPTWSIRSTFFIFLSINSFHNPLYDTAIYSTSFLYKNLRFSYFQKFIFVFSFKNFKSVLLYHTLHISSMRITMDTLTLRIFYLINPSAELIYFNYQIIILLPYSFTWLPPILPQLLQHSFLTAVLFQPDQVIFLICFFSSFSLACCHHDFLYIGGLHKNYQKVSSVYDILLYISFFAF